MKKNSEYFLMKSLTVYLLENETASSMSSLELYEAWQAKSKIVVRSAVKAAWILDFLEEMKTFPKDDLREAARLDGFL